MSDFCLDMAAPKPVISVWMWSRLQLWGIIFVQMSDLGCSDPEKCNFCPEEWFRLEKGAKLSKRVKYIVMRLKMVYKW